MAAIGNSPTQQAFTPAIDYFSGNGSTTAFTLSRPVASVAQVQVTIDNVAQNPSSAYTVSANTITFTSAPLSGTNNIYVYYTSPITQVIAPSQGTVQTAQLGNITNIASGNSSLTLQTGSGNTTAVTVDTSQQVGVNRVPSAGGGPLQVGFDSSANAGVRIQTTNASTAGEILNFINSSNSTAGKVIYGTSQTSVAYQTTTAGQSTGAVLQNSGIAFPATQVASSDANTLDDYEEGTWTPNVVSGSNNSTWTVKSGRYIKVGGLVTCWFVCDGGNSGTSGSDLQINGIPFTPVSIPNNCSTGVWGTNSTTPQVNGNIFNAGGTQKFYYGGNAITTQASYASGMFTYQAA